MLYVDIYKDFGDFKLNVKFESGGDVTGLLGASGSGKSLTLKCIAGIETPDRGQILLNDRILFDSQKKINLKPQERRVGYLFQDYALFPNMSVVENIKTGIKSGNKSEIIKKIIQEMKLNGLEEKKPIHLSGGEKQRTALARILVNEPEILLLDEPFSALDEYLKWKIEIEVKEIIDRYKIPSVFVSHSRDEVFRICDSIVVMTDGISEEKQITKDLFKNPKTYASAQISGCKNYSEIEIIDKNKILAKNWGIELSIDDLSNCELIGVRSHYIEITENPKEKNTYPLLIDKVIEELFSVALMVSSENKLGYDKIRIDIDKNRWKELEGKENLYFRIKPENIMLLEK
ncbi:MAG: ATP-binding cassette domain-containing protein [Tissierellia bacterium]|nr:ATP-binding cassette domain-containing protein [Tissierellia bacterium]